MLLDSIFSPSIWIETSLNPVVLVGVLPLLIETVNESKILFLIFTNSLYSPAFSGVHGIHAVLVALRFKVNPIVVIYSC